MEILKEYKCAPILRHPNALLIPVTVIERDMRGAHLFNQIYQACRDSGYKTIPRTPSGAISQARGLFRPPMWDARRLNNHCIEITVIDVDGMWRVQFRNDIIQHEKSEKYYGRKAFKLFKDKCLEFGVSMDKLAISPEEAKKAKSEIPSPPTHLSRESFAHKTFTNVHHIDFRSSYPTGLINTHPEFRPVVEYIYTHRFEDNDKWKLVLNASIGMMQSPITEFKWAHLARDAIMDNNRRIKEMAQELTENGNVILLYNTDGIWYMGDIYHNNSEGDGLGSWHTDHKNCTFRAKSNGAYEFIEDGRYHVRLRGRTTLDTIKPRTEWKWGDIYHEDAIIHDFTWTEGIGILKDGVLV